MKQDPSIGSGCWYLGIIYINRDDRRIIVPKRNTSMGWTINLARPLAIPLTILIMGAVLAPFYLLEQYDIESPLAYIAAFVGVLGGLISFCRWMAKPERY